MAGTSPAMTDRRPLGPISEFQKFCLPLTRISNIRWPARPNRGALRNVINAGRDAVDAGSAFDEWR
jgi:hypothetical protein